MDSQATILMLIEQVAYLRGIIKAQISDNLAALDTDCEHILTLSNAQLNKALEVTADYQKYIEDNSNG